MSQNQEAIVEKYTSMGFPLELVILALEKTGGKDDDLLTHIFAIR